MLTIIWWEVSDGMDDKPGTTPPSWPIRIISTTQTPCKGNWDVDIRYESVPSWELRGFE